MVVYRHVEHQVADVFVYLILPLMVAGTLYWVTRTDRLRGLLAALPVLYVLWLPNMEQTPMHIIPVQVDIMVKATTASLMAIAVMAIVRIGDWRLGLWIILASNLVVGLQFSYVGIYHGATLPFTADGPSVAEVVKRFIPQYLAACSILFGPLFARMFRRAGRHSGVAGAIGYHLALLGVLVLIAANLLALMFGLGGYSDFAVGRTYQRLGWLIYLGLGGYGVGLLLLYRAAKRYGLLPNVVDVVLMAMLPMAIPLTFVLPFIGSTQPVSPLYGVPMLWVIPEPLILVFGVIWLLLCAWLVNRERDAPAPPASLPQPG